MFMKSLMARWLICLVVVALFAGPAVVMAVDANTVGSEQIIDLSIKPWDIAKGAVKSIKIAVGAVRRGHIANGAVNSAKIADGSVTGIDIADGAGSGLSADLLDGLNSAAFAASGHNHDDKYYQLARPNPAQIALLKWYQAGQA